MRVEIQRGRSTCTHVKAGKPPHFLIRHQSEKINKRRRQMSRSTMHQIQLKDRSYSEHRRTRGKVKTDMYTT